MNNKTNLKSDIMKIIKRNPGFNSHFQPNFNNLFEDDFFKQNQSPTAKWSKLPPVNISESEEDFKVDLAAPGFLKGDFKVKIENKLLIIEGSRKDNENEESENFTRREFIQSSFTRSFQLPENKISEDAIQASYENGVLSLSLPKKEEAKTQAPKTIEIS